MTRHYGPLLKVTKGLHKNSVYLDYTRHVMQNYLKICAVIWSGTLFVLVTLTVFSVSHYKITQIFI